MNDKMALGVGLVAFLTVAVPRSISAQSLQYDDWTVGLSTDRTNVFAATANDSGSMFAKVCALGGGCEYRLSFEIRCEQGIAYPALINTDAGALSITMRCAGENPSMRSAYVYTLDNTEPIDKLIVEATRLGVAFPLIRDQFQVLRFSLRGATAATVFMRSAWLRSRETGQPPSVGTRDSRL